MLALKQWLVEYIYRYKIRSVRGGEYAECFDLAIVLADSEEEAKKLVLEAGKTGAFDWAGHEFVGLRMLVVPARTQTLVFSDSVIKAIQEHTQGSYIERKEIDIDIDLPLDREG